MRHRIPGRKLGRDAKHRKALMRNLATSLITHQQIKTTQAKAQELEPFMNKIIKEARRRIPHEAHRYVYRHLFTSDAQKKLFTELIPRFEEMEVNGQYCRIRYLARRKGDSAKMAMIELVGNQAYLKEMEQIHSWHENPYIETYWKYEYRLLK